MENKNIYTKLLEFQKLGITIIKDGKNSFFKKDGKDSKYCTLNEVLDKVKKPLNDMGVLIVFQPENEGLKTTLYDTESQTEVSSYMKYVDCSNAQKMLACNTYYRRGSIVSLLGLEEDDDDGNKASKEVKPKKDLPLTEAEKTDLQKKLDNCNTIDELNLLWSLDAENYSKNGNIVNLFTKRKTQIEAK